MKEEFSELVEYLDQKFQQTATKEDVQGLSTRLIHVEEGLQEVRGEVRELKQTVHDLVNSIDKLAKAIDDLRTEYSAMAMQMNRHEKWIKQLAEKLGMKLEYE
jgi:archaellum component FlaC